MPQLRSLIRQVADGEIEMVTPISGDRDDEGRWTRVDLRAVDMDGNETTYTVKSSTPIETLAALRVAIDASGTSYLTTPSIDIYNVFLDEDEWNDEFLPVYEELYDEYEEEYGE